MKFPIAAMLALVLANAATDFFIYRHIRHSKWRKWLKIIHIAISAILYLVIGGIAIFIKKGQSPEIMAGIMWGLLVFLTCFISKLIYAAFSLLGTIPLLFKQKHKKAFSFAGFSFGIAFFFLVCWSAFITPAQLDVKEITIETDNLPESFHGYRIVQFSDLHTGTFGKRTGIAKRLVEKINESDADLVVFTGDIVNRQTNEILPFIPVLKQIHAKDGIFSILGNHDYGDYFKWKSAEEKQANLQSLIQIQQDSLSWNLLLNEHRFIRHDSDSICIIGVENWGEPPFHTYGDLSKSYPQLTDKTCKILLSHNPVHWEAEVKGKSTIGLTLSGHTHAMQTMFSIGNKQYSPASHRYKHWHGLYSENNQNLYVNIGIGEVGLPIRIGATPELTIITLQSTNDK